jgi:uncharacterized membrane protein
MIAPTDDRGAAWPRTAVRWLLGTFMLSAGVGHFLATETFLAQVPTWLPERTAIVLVSGGVEVGLGLAMLAAPARWRPLVGSSLAIFLVLVFPGNVYQAVAGIDAFGLDTPTARWVRLLFQPVLIVLALWSTREPSSGGPP